MTMLAMLFLIVGGAFSQTKVNGTVVSQDDGQPVIGASVIVVGTQVGTVTNAEGKFSLTCPEGKNTLRISYVGMEPLEVGARPNMRILLTSDRRALDEVIVIGYGTAKKSAFTGSATEINATDITNHISSSATSALVGKVAGVIATTGGNGGPGSMPTIRIRGFVCCRRHTSLYCRRCAHGAGHEQHQPRGHRVDVGAERCFGIGHLR